MTYSWRGIVGLQVWNW